MALFKHNVPQQPSKRQWSRYRAALVALVGFSDTLHPGADAADGNDDLRSAREQLRRTAAGVGRDKAGINADLNLLYLHRDLWLAGLTERATALSIRHPRLFNREGPSDA